MSIIGKKFFFLIIFLKFAKLYPSTFSEVQQGNISLDELIERPSLLGEEIRHPWLHIDNAPFHFDFSGYIKNDSFLDSRQTLDFGRGAFLIVPLPYLPDRNGCDINSQGRYNMVTLQSRTRLNIIGPEVYNLKTRGYIETDFFGNVAGVEINTAINTVSMRHAFMALRSEHFGFLAGQTYHPLVLPIEAPNTISFNSGVPMTPFLFNPQMRFSYFSDGLQLDLSFIGNVALLGDGPDGLSTLYVRNSMMPEINFHARYKYERHFVGADVNIKRLVPRLVTNDDIKSVEHLNNIGIIGYFRAENDLHHLYGKVTYIENGSDFVMIGGYAVSCVNPNNDKRQYANIRFIAAWLDYDYTWDRYEIGCFFGGGKNLGTTVPVITSITHDDIIEPTIYGFGNNISYVARISPRIRAYPLAPFIIGTEVEWTRSSYGTLTDTGKITNPIPVDNIRWELACYYVF